MSLSCAAEDAESWVELSDDLIISVGTEFCVECNRLIPFGEEHYKVWLWKEHEEWGHEVHLAQHRCCEACGDLALSWLELGYCWSFGDLRSDIKELNYYI